MRIKIYRKLIQPIVHVPSCQGFSEINEPFDSAWYDDTDFIRTTIEERFKQKNTDPWASLRWDEQYIECGEIER